MKYQITIKDLETGEIVKCQEGEAIVGGLAYDDPNSTDGVKGTAFAVLAGKPLIALGAIDCAETAIKAFKKELMDDFIMGLADQIKEERDENN